MSDAAVLERVPEAVRSPFHLRGNFAPIGRETESFVLEVEGGVPEALDGLYLRNGPNPVSGSSPHWFVGDGMLHAVSLRGGGAESYRNRWVRTETFGQPPSPGMPHNVANTAVVGYAGSILALVESHPPTEVTADLDAIGAYDFGGDFGQRPFTAHPLIDPVTRDLFAFGYSPFPPYLTYHHADAQGRLLRSEPISVNGPTMVHAFAMTENRVVFFDLPVTFQLELLAKGMPFAWSDSYPARVGVMPKSGGDKDVVWAEVKPGYVFHVMNAWEDGGDTVLDVARYERMWDGARGASNFNFAVLHQWRISADGVVTERPLGERSLEFPVTNPRFTGRPYRFGYAVGTARADGVIGESVLRFDHATGEMLERRFAPGDLVSEFTFVPASPTSAEGEGWLMGYVYEAERGTSSLYILDAEDVTGEPTAIVRLPQRVPQGFHGAWVSRTDPTANSQA